MTQPWTNYQDECLFKGTKVYYKPASYQISEDKIPEKWVNKDGTVLLEVVEPFRCVGITVYEKDGKHVQKIRSYFDARIVRAGAESEVIEFLQCSGIVSFHGVEKTTID